MNCSLFSIRDVAFNAKLGSLFPAICTYVLADIISLGKCEDNEQQWEMNAAPYQSISHVLS